LHCAMELGTLPRMPAADDTPPSRWLWLDRWFEPRWRALLTWLGLVVLVGVAVDFGGLQGARKMVGAFFDQLDPMLPTPVGLRIRVFATMSNIFALLFWVEPLALRLNLLRSVTWVGVRSASFVLAAGIATEKVTWLVAMMAASAVAALLLRGRRSRPAMPLFAGALVCVEISIYERFGVSVGTFWMFALVTSLPYALVLLYGTRRLRPEERVRGST
jgi:hypothetical protein